MARGKKDVGNTEYDLDFQIFDGNVRNYICQKNELVMSKQSLKLNSSKLIRAAIMQVVREDEDLKPYLVSIKDLATLLGVSESNLYRDIRDIVQDITSNPIQLRKETPKKQEWISIPWIQMCKYESDVGVMIQLNSLLKPYLINLREKYEQYSYTNILPMKSVFSIRIFELIQSKIMLKVLPKDGLDVEIPISEIKESLNCEDKYQKFANFKARVLDTATQEINKVTLYTLAYEVLKKGRIPDSIKFHINMSYH